MGTMQEWQYMQVVTVIWFDCSLGIVDWWF